MIPMCEDWDNFFAHPTIEMSRLVGGVCWSCHEEPAKFFAPNTFLMRKVFFERVLRRSSLLSVSSLVVSNVFTFAGFCDGSCLSLSSISVSCFNIKTYIVRKIRKLLNQVKERDTHYSHMDTTTGSSPLRKGSGTRTPFDDHWHE